MSESDLPEDAPCGVCFAVVPLDPRGWLLDEDGASQICRCGRCGSIVFGIVGTAEYCERTTLDAVNCVSAHRRELLH